MYNWSVDLRELNKKPKYALLWKIEQAINFGLNGEKLDKKLVRKFWNRINIDPARRKLLRLLLWPNKS